MSSALMTLETAPDDRAAVDAIFREAHTMKGTAGMVGLMRTSHLAHHLEDLLSQVRSGERPATPELIDTMLRMLDGLSSLIALSTDGDPESVDKSIEDLMQLAPPAPAEAAARAAQALAPPPANAPAAPAPQSAPPPPPTPSPAGTPAAQAPKPAEVIVNRRHLDSASLEVPVARIDELNRLVGEASAAQLRVGAVLGSELKQDPDAVVEYRDLTNVINRLQEVTERTRMVPVGTLEPILHRTVRDSARNAGKNVRWVIEGEDIEVDRGVLEQLVAPMLHIVRNAVGHGVERPADRIAAGKPEQAVVKLSVTQAGSKVEISISDDGAGINVAAVRAVAAKNGINVATLSDEDVINLIFRSGVSTAKEITEESGRGVGLDVVTSAVAAVRGAIEVDNHPGLGCEFRIMVPITLTVLPCLVVSVAGQTFALPMHRIVRMVESQPVQVVSGKTLAVIDGQAIPVSNLATLLGLPSTASGPWVLIGEPTPEHAFQVEAVLQKRDVVVRGLQGRLRDLQVVSGASIEPNGSIVLVLDVPALRQRSQLHLEPVAGSEKELVAASVRAPSVMVVDDALMIRELQRSILERAGYDVRTANDGAEALAMLGDHPSDLVVTDIEMPNLDGFHLTEAIRAHPRLANIPVLIVTSRTSEEDHQRGLDAGADGYIVKTSFDEAGLLTAVSRLLGRTSDSEAPTHQGRNRVGVGTSRE